MCKDEVFKVIEDLFEEKKYRESIVFFEDANNLDFFSNLSIGYIVSAYIELEEFYKADLLVNEIWDKLQPKLQVIPLSDGEKEQIDFFLLSKIELLLEFKKYFSVIYYAYRYRNFLST